MVSSQLGPEGISWGWGAVVVGRGWGLVLLAEGLTWRERPGRGVLLVRARALVSCVL